jgi:thiosulfate/3-mercaptopyruvate sulfurtransferase
MRTLAALLLMAAAGEMPLIQPKDLAAQLASAKPVILQVGPNVLFRSKHIPGAIYAGPAATPQGLEVLNTAAAKLPHDRDIVIYCGCCPWDHCPNVRPAIEALKQMGFTRVKVMYVATNFKADWIDHGYPVE